MTSPVRWSSIEANLTYSDWQGVRISGGPAGGIAQNISVIFTDIEMPGSMNGIKLAHAVRDRWPPIKIIATSGHYGFREGDLPTGGRFLPKPYTLPQISEALREATFKE